MSKTKLSEVITAVKAGTSVVSDDNACGEQTHFVLKTSSVKSGSFNILERKPVTSRTEIQRLSTPVEKGSIIMSRMNTPDLVAESAYVSETDNNTFLPDRLWSIQVDESRVVPRWLAYLFSSPKMLTLLRAKASGTSNSMKNISKKDVLSICVDLPSIDEQQKIAATISTWDRAIELHDKLIALKEKQKQGLMQVLLTGKKRLLDDNGVPFSGEWIKCKMKDIAHIKKGQALSSGNLTNGNYPVIAGGKTSPYSHGSFNSENTITISASGAYAGYVAYHPYKFWASDCSVLEGINGVRTQFVYYVARLLQDKIYSLQSGGAQPHIYPKDISVLKVQCPELSEQVKIVDVLSRADSELSALKRKRELLNQQKQGLMQQLLG